MKEERRDQTYFNYISIYIFAYAAGGSMLPLIGQYLAYLGFTGTQTGIITGGGITIAAFVAPFWGSLYHRFQNGRIVIVIICSGAAAGGLVMLTVKSFIPVLLMYGCIYFFYCGSVPIIDAMTLGKSYSFSSVRKWGVVGFAAGVFISGLVSQRFNLTAIFPMFSLCYLIAGIFAINTIVREKKYHLYINEDLNESPNNIEMKKNAEAEPKGKKSYKLLLSDKKYMALVASAFFLHGPILSHNTYFGFLYTQDGGTVAGIGLVFLLMVASEAPFMAWSEKLAEKFTLEKTILAAMIFSAVRFFWYSTGPSPGLLLATFFTQGMVNGILLVEFIRYVKKLRGNKMIGMAVALYQAIAANFGAVACQLAGGRVLDHFGGSGVYMVFAVFNVIGISIYLTAGLHKCENR